MSRRATLDHLLIGGPDLDAAVRALEQHTGVSAVEGGSHPELGTRSAFARLGARHFVEIVAPDPRLSHGAFAARLAGLAGPQLLMWAAHTDDAAAIVARADEAGYRTVVTVVSRTRLDGAVLRWRTIFVTGHGAGALVPYFVEWPRGEHPSREGPPGLNLASFRIEGPRPEAIRSVLDALGVAVAVRHGERERMVASLETPKGALNLASAAAPA